MWTKLAGQALQPLNLFLEVAVVALVLRGIGRRRLAKWLAGTAFCFLWLASTPIVSKALLRAIEGRHPPIAVEAVPTADAIVCLGGGLSPAVPPRLTSDLSEAGDRILLAARLFRAGKAPIVVAAGGGAYARAGIPESLDIADLLVEWGVPRPLIVEESGSTDTHDNAVMTKSLLDARGQGGRVLLVTSAMHMPRALAALRAAGIDAVACPTDFLGTAPSSEGRTILDYLPDSEALEHTSAAVHEVLGLLWYRLRGWA